MNQRDQWACAWFTVGVLLLVSLLGWGGNLLSQRAAARAAEAAFWRMSPEQREGARIDYRLRQEMQRQYVEDRAAARDWGSRQGGL